MTVGSEWMCMTKMFNKAVYSRQSGKWQFVCLHFAPTDACKTQLGSGTDHWRQKILKKNRYLRNWVCYCGVTSFSTVAMQQDICKETAEVAKRASAAKVKAARASRRREWEAAARPTLALPVRAHTTPRRTPRAQLCALPAPTTQIYPHYSDLVN